MKFRGLKFFLLKYLVYCSKKGLTKGELIIYKVHRSNIPKNIKFYNKVFISTDLKMLRIVKDKGKTLTVHIFSEVRINVNKTKLLSASCL